MRAQLVEDHSYRKMLIEHTGYIQYELLYTEKTAWALL